MKEKLPGKSALVSIFPNIEAAQEFISDCGSADRFMSFVTYAHELGLIREKSQQALEDFIRKNSLEPQKQEILRGLSFEEIIDRKNDMLNIKVSIRNLTDRVNMLIQKSHLNMPQITNSMITRLKREAADTPHKRDTVRCLAFWLGYQQKESNFIWNYQTLVGLCPQVKKQSQFTEGVRIGFSLFSRGDVIGYDAINWLKKEIKAYIKDAMQFYPYGGWGTVKSHDITTLFIDFPKHLQQDHPSAYGPCLNYAISIAHQIAIRWALSTHCTNRRFLSIGITAGEFSTLDAYLLPLLNAKLPGDPVIRMTEFSKQCVLINDIRTMFCIHPTTTTLFNGETIQIWWVTGLWSLIYWDFIPGLLEDPVLGGSKEAEEKSRQLFWNTDSTCDLKSDSHTNAIETFYKFPQNSLFGNEIAKTLYYRKRFWEATEILRLVLSTDPANLNARVIQMSIYRNLGLDATSKNTAHNYFLRAEAEADYIQEICQYHDEDFLCEFAVLKLARAIRKLQWLRKEKGIIQINDTQIHHNNVFTLLNETLHILTKALTISVTGYRSIYLYTCAYCLKAILQTHPELFVSESHPVMDINGTYQNTTMEIFENRGWLRADFPPELRQEFLEKRLTQIFTMHADSVNLRTYIPTIKYCFAVVMWDFVPFMTHKTVQKIIQWLTDAKKMAEKLVSQGLYIYSYTRCYGEVMTPEDFIADVSTAQKAIGKQIEKSDGKSLNDPIDHDVKNGLSLFTLHI